MCGKHWTFSPALGGTFQRTTRFLWPVFLSFTWQFKHQDCSLSNGRMQQNANDNETTWLNSVYYEMTYKNSCRFFIHQLTNLLNYVDFFFFWWPGNTKKKTGWRNLLVRKERPTAELMMKLTSSFTQSGADHAFPQSMLPMRVTISWPSTKQLVYSSSFGRVPGWMNRLWYSSIQQKGTEVIKCITVIDGHTKKR